MKVGIEEVKSALKEESFRKTLPQEMEKYVNSYLKNPNCSCNASFYRKILNDYREQLTAFYPEAEFDPIVETPNHLKAPKESWIVINCHVDELEGKVKALPRSRKQISIARYEDQVTLVANIL